jgi:beta-glucosidase
MVRLPRHFHFSTINTRLTDTNTDDYSDALILNVAASCANTIVVIHNAGIRLVDQWIEHPNVTAVVFAHLPGQDSGRAVVQLLYGFESFSGKLPYTVAKNESDYTDAGNPTVSERLC